MKSIRSSIVLSAGTALFCCNVSAQITAVWQRPGDGNWTDPSNWFRTFPLPAGPLGTFPNGSEYDAVIDHEKEFAVGLDDGVSVASLRLGTTATLRGQGSLSLAALTLHGAITDGMNVELQGSLAGPSNRFGVISGSTLSINGSLSGYVNALANAHVLVRDGAELAFSNGRIWSASQDPAIANARLTNAGTIRSIVGINEVYAKVQHVGSSANVAVTNSVLTLGDVTGLANYTIDSRSTLALASGEIPIGASVIGAGSLHFFTGEFRVAGDVQLSGKLVLENAARVHLDRAETTVGGLDVLSATPSLKTSGTLTVAGPVVFPRFDQFRAATFEGVGTTVFAGGGIISGEPIIKDHTVVNRSQLELYAVKMQAIGNARLINDAGGTLLFNQRSKANALSQVNPNSSGILENRGHLRFLTGSTFEGLWTLKNDGYIVVEKGAAASFQLGASGAGRLEIGQGASLELLNAGTQPSSIEFTQLSVAPTGTLTLGTRLGLVDGPLTINSPVEIAGGLITKNGRVIFSKPVKAGAAEVVHATFVDTAQFDSLKADGSVTFNAAGNSIGTLTSGDLLTVTNNGKLNIGTFAAQRGFITGTGLTRIEHFTPKQSFGTAGSGTLIIGRVNFGNPVGGYDAYGGTTIFLEPMTQRGAPKTLLARSAEVRFAKSEYLKTTWTEMGGKIVLLPGNDKVLRTSGSASPTFLRLDGSLDLTDNGLIVDYSTSTSFGLLLGYVFAGYASGAWNGNGIISSSALADPRLGIGVAEASDVLGPSGGIFFNETVDGTTALVRVTLKGDADLNGVVNISDFARVARAFNSQSLWSSGDFNYDFRTDVADFALLASNFNTSLPISSPRQNVPEPSAFAVTVLATLPFRRRR